MTRSNKTTIAVIVCALALVLSSLFYFQNHSEKESQAELSSQETVDYRGPVDDCLQFELLYSRDGILAADCTANYVHYYPKNYDPKVAEKTKGDLRIGSFNLFHLGDNQAPMKSLSLVAKIINQWDVVGAQEMMPLPGEWAVANQKIYDFLVANRANVVFPHQNWKVTFPGYLALLHELHEIDPSWALILQPSPEGEGTSGEMAGFFYRSSRVRLKDWGYCPRDGAVELKSNESLFNYGCLTQIPPDQRQLMSRVAFTAFFQAGNFDFIGVTTHVRFRPSDQEADRKAQEVSICNSHENLQKCKVANEFVGRFYEVQAIARQIHDMKQIAGDQDVVFMGDFNIEFAKNNQALWNASLKDAPGYVVTQTAPTTLSIKSAKMASNYDHFILDPQATKECDINTVRDFNFTDVENSTDPVKKDIARMLSPAMQAVLLSDASAELEMLTKFQLGKNKGLRPLSDKEKADMTKSYADSVTRMKANKYGALLELISDHIPVEMNCRIGTRDDD
ncbi:hypothetical protein [Bdellovibrio sp. HCB337]|uniref:hypothetical protein n=1 Tax=Bdellovibrio sp. HCB337 TaxID=3394358 RepID=UPI0039A67524